MPYGLPGAVKLSRGLLVERWDGIAPKISLRAGTLVQPLHPGADQDGRDGEWRCRTVDGFEVAILEIELRNSL